MVIRVNFGLLAVTCTCACICSSVSLRVCAVTCTYISALSVTCTYSTVHVQCMFQRCQGRTAVVATRTRARAATGWRRVAVGPTRRHTRPSPFIWARRRRRRRRLRVITSTRSSDPTSRRSSTTLPSTTAVSGHYNRLTAATSASLSLRASHCRYAYAINNLHALPVELMSNLISTPYLFLQMRNWMCY